MGSGSSPDRDTPTLSPGAVFGERYRLIRHISEGGMGTVWAAERIDDGEHVALKFMKAAADQIGLRHRFLREARAALAIEHPNVVRVFEVLDLPEYPAIVMELLHGESLAARLSRDPPLTPSEVADTLLPVVSAVSTAHQLGIVHRDLKPDNIFVSRDPEGATVVKVLDFGIAKLTSTETAAAATAHVTTTGSLLGTPAYMSPEQVFGEKDVDHRTDVWSLGMILYECLTGVLPSRAENVGQIIKLILTREDWKIEEAAPDLGEDWIDVVRRMLRRDRRKRPTLRQLAEVLERHATIKGPPVAEEPRASADRVHVGFASTFPVASAKDDEDRPPRTLGRPRAALGVVLIGAAAVGGYLWLTPPSATGSEAAASTAAATPVAKVPVPEPSSSPIPASAPDTVAPVAPSVSAQPRKPPANARASKEQGEPPPKPSASAAPPPPQSSSPLQSAVVGQPPF